MSKQLHRCPAKGCTAQVPFELLACRPHWFALPKPVRQKISESWARGDLERWAAGRQEALELLQVVL